MKFKRNITITASCMLSELIICLIPIYIMFFLTASSELGIQWIGSLIFVPLIIFIIHIICLIISVVSSIFMHLTIILEKDFLVIKNKTKITTIKYDEIHSIVYDLGEYGGKSQKGKNSRLVLYDKDYNRLLDIYNPSIMMVHLIKKRCKNAEVDYYNKNRLLWLFLITILITFVIGLIDMLN